MDVKELLRSVRRTSRELKTLTMEYDSLATRAMAVNKPMNPVKVQTSMTNRQEDILVNLAELEKIITEKVDEITRRTLTAETMLGYLEESKHRETLRMYYLIIGTDGMPFSWYDVAQRMGYSVRQVRRFHEDAIAILRKEGEVIVV